MELTRAQPQLHLKYQFLRITALTAGEGDAVTVSIKCLESFLYKYYKLIKSKILKKKKKKTQKYHFLKLTLKIDSKYSMKTLKSTKNEGLKKSLERSFIFKLFFTLQVQNMKNLMKGNYYKILHFYTQLYYYQHI